MLDVLINQNGEKKADRGQFRISDRADKPIKSIIKSVSWRLVGTIDTMIISYFITGKLTVAVSIGGVEVFTKTILYYFHERVWAHIHRIRLRIFEEKEQKQYENKLYEVKRIEGSAFGPVD
jgi:uncharacterized membrane protein